MARTASEAGVKSMDIYQCLGNKTRLRIVHLLKEAPLSVSDLQELLGVSQGTLSRHLRRLKGAKIVEGWRFESWMIYRLTGSPGPILQRHLKCLHDCGAHEPILREDRERLAEKQSEVAWAGVAVATLRKAEQKRAKRRARTALLVA